MKVNREWVTPITAGAFLLSGVTGALMFFHVDSGLNKVAHEWLSWVLVIGVGLHLVTNIKVFKRYFSQPKGRWLMGAFVVLLAVSFVPVGGGKPPFVAPLEVLSHTPLDQLVLVSELNSEQLLARLTEAGVQVESQQQSVSDLVGDDFRAQANMLKLIMVEDASG